MSLSPLVLLDCDGVIFPFAPSKHPERQWDDLEERHVRLSGPTQHLSPTVINTLRELMDQVEFRYCTSWFSDTEDFEATLDFPPMPWVKDQAPAGDWWKLHAVQELSRSHRILWIDDDIKDDEEALEWLSEASEHVEYISPDLYSGISREELQKIQAWVDRVTEKS